MSIVSSEIIRSVDLGGAYAITERHTDSAGAVHEWRYVAGAGVDTTARLSEHAEQLALQLAEAETEGLLS